VVHNQAGVPLGQTSTITASDLMRIKSSIAFGEAKASGTIPPNDAATLRHTLRERSKARVAHWGNTLEAQRAKKESKRQEEAEKYEASRRRMDEDEALFQAKQRQDAIQRARELLRDDTERVKTLKSSILVSDAMKEREYQIEIKRAQEDRRRKADEYWHQKTMEQIAAANKVEERKAEEARQRAQQAKLVQTEQLEAMREQYIAMKMEEKREGELISRQVVLHSEEARRKELEKKEAERLRQLKTLTDNRELMKTKKESDAAAAAAEEARLQRFADLKEKKMKMRAERVAAIAEEKHMLRQRMIDKQVAYLASMQQNEDQRVADQVKEADDKRDAMLAAKEAARAKAEAEAQEFNSAARRAKELQAKKDKEDGLIEADRLKKLFDQQLEDDRQKELGRRNKALELRKFHQRQCNEKVARKKRMQDAQDRETEQQLRLVTADDAEFKEYALNLIKAAKEEGKDPRPLICQLQKTLNPPLVSS